MRRAVAPLSHRTSRNWATTPWIAGAIGGIAHSALLIACATLGSLSRQFIQPAVQLPNNDTALSLHVQSGFWLAVVLALLWPIVETLSTTERLAGSRSWLPRLQGVAALLFVMLVAFDAGARNCAQASGAITALAATLGVLGIALRAWAIGSLGQWFLDAPVVLPAQPRVQHGIYRWCSHPSEIGLLMILAAMSLLLASWLGAFFWGLVMVTLSAVRVAVEERALRAQSVPV